MRSIFSSMCQKFMILWSIFCMVILSNISYADRQWWGNIGTNTNDIFDYYAGAVNEDRIQDNALNDISNIQWQYASEYKITNSLDAIRLQITPYIQRVMYLWLSIAVILIVYNGFLMVTNSVNGGAGDTSKVKTNLINIAIWLTLLCGFYVIIEVWLATISYLTS